MSDLRKLIEAVEAGTLRIDGDFALGCVSADVAKLWPNDDPRHRAVCLAYDGCLNSAKALHDALLPGMAWELGTLSCSATVYAPDYPGEDFEAPCFSAECGMPSRAWLLAILNAYEAQERKQ